jgi:amino acid transporter
MFTALVVMTTATMLVAFLLPCVVLLAYFLSKDEESGILNARLALLNMLILSVLLHVSVLFAWSAAVGAVAAVAFVGLSNIVCFGLEAMILRGLANDLREEERFRLRG